MATTPNNFGIGYHILTDGLDTNATDNLVAHLIDIQPSWVNISGGSRFTQAMQLVERLRRDAPAINIILRQVIANGIKDNGVSSVLTPEQFFNVWIAPIKSWYKEFKPYCMTDNEGFYGGEKMKVYSDWMAKEIVIGYPDGIQFAVGRTPAGIPQISDYQYLDSMFRALESYGGVWSPNEYFGQTPQLSNNLPGRFHYGIDYCLSKGIKKPTIVIGEYAAAQAHLGQVGEIILDPYKGFQTLGWSQEKLFDEAMAYYEPWIQPHNVAVCVFGVGVINEFQTFAVDTPFYRKSKAYKDAGKGVITTSPVYNPPPDPNQPENFADFSDSRWTLAIIKPLKQGTRINVRIKPTTTGNTPIGAIDSEKPGYFIADQSWGNWGQVRWANDSIYGWVDMTLLSITAMTPTQYVSIPKADYDQIVSDVDTIHTLTERLQRELKQ